MSSALNMRAVVGAASDAAQSGLQSAVARLARDLAGLGARLADGALRRHDAQHLHRLEAESELLAPVGGSDVEPRQLLDPLEAIANGMAVREQLLRGAGDVAVRVEEGLERAHELRVVLGVVGEQRRDRLVVEAL